MRDAAVLAPAGLVYLRGHGLPTIGEMATRFSVGAYLPQRRDTIVEYSRYNEPVEIRPPF